MAARVTVKARFVGSADGSWTNLRVSEAELALPALRRLLAAALQCSPAALAYLQYQDGDGDWLTVCNDADILDGVDELGGSLLHLQVLWRGARDAFQQQQPQRQQQPALADRSPAARPAQSEREQLYALINRGDIEVSLHARNTGGVDACVSLARVFARRRRWRTQASSKVQSSWANGPRQLKFHSARPRSIGLPHLPACPPAPRQALPPPPCRRHRRCRRRCHVQLRLKRTQSCLYCRLLAACVNRDALPEAIAAFKVLKV
jgi:hypothetical protein